jgi:hypothetical protein
MCRDGGQIDNTKSANQVFMRPDKPHIRSKQSVQRDAESSSVYPDHVVCCVGGNDHGRYPIQVDPELNKKHPFRCFEVDSAHILLLEAIYPQDWRKAHFVFLISEYRTLMVALY